MFADHEIPAPSFAGELFLRLANEGRLVVDAARADEIITGLEATLAQIRTRLRHLQMWQQLPGGSLDDVPSMAAGEVVDAAFADQLAPGRLEQAVTELPKYIEALHRARMTALSANL